MTAPRRINWRRVKTHRNYEIAELAKLLGVSRSTVRNWIKSGLPVISDKRPRLIVGEDFRRWSKAARAARKSKCRPGEMYCFKCRQPRKPALGMVDFAQRTEILGLLSALCEACERPMFRACRLDRIHLVMPGVCIAIPDRGADIKG